MAKATKQKEETTLDSPTYYEEWDVKINKGQAEKMKVKRKKVGITEDEAEILNAGVLSGGNNYAVMYFLPESNES